MNKNFTPISPKLLASVATKDKPRQIKYPNLRAGGPPRKEEYKDEYIKEAYKYLQDMQGKDQLIAIEDFAFRIGHDDDTLMHWANKRIDKSKGFRRSNLVHPDFFSAIKSIKKAQRYQLMNGVTFGFKKMNALGGMFLLTNNHNMSNKFDHTSKGKELQVTPILNGSTNVPIPEEKN